MEGFVSINSIINNTRTHNIRRGFNNKSHNNTPMYMFQDKPIVYNHRTMNYYKTARKCHIDPILDTEVDESIAFKYRKQWDPYTGQVSCIDPFGALYFNPIGLIYNFYIKRLDGLWKDGEDTNDGYYEGYYDRFVGAGSDMEVVGRDKYPELYLFRLPIVDCYLTPDHKSSIITLGPLLNDEDISQLEELSKNSTVRNMYYQSFGRQCPSITKMKYLYDNAISKNPEQLTFKHNYPVLQHYYVEELKCM